MDSTLIIVIAAGASLIGGIITGLSTWLGFKKRLDRVENRQDRLDDMVIKLIREFVSNESCQQQSLAYKAQTIEQFKKGNKQFESLHETMSKIFDIMGRIDKEVVKINSSNSTLKE